MEKGKAMPLDSQEATLMRINIGALKAEVARLKADVERLTKALDQSLDWGVPHYVDAGKWPDLAAYLRGKEGKDAP